MPGLNCPYLIEIHQALPRLLAGFDRNPASPTLGIGDRFRWGWKLIDFANGTFQGAAHGLARLAAAGLLPAWLPRQAVLDRVAEMVAATPLVVRPDGSSEEAFPYESSFCVTALVAYDLLAAVDLLDDEPLRDSARRVVEPLIGHLLRHDEHHGLISNHLATAVAALYRWHALTGSAKAEARGRMFLDRILAHQSREGWFREYDGADPGYQSLATHYLADLHRLRPDLGLAGPLARSLEFIAHFRHPDGSFGGLYGSRNTRFYYPGGFEALAGENAAAAGLAAAMRHSIAGRRVVTLASMDAPNLIPMFNSYCMAAALRPSGAEPAAEAPPALREGSFRRVFDEAGLVVDKGPAHYTVVATGKGGVCCHFTRDGASIDAGVLARDPAGRLYSTQVQGASEPPVLEGDILSVTAPLLPVRQRMPSPVDFIILRLLSMTVMRVPAIAGLVKKALVRLLITGKGRPQARNRRVITLGPRLHVADSWVGAESLERVPANRPFSAIHMASQGYWQVQDDAPAGSAVPVGEGDDQV